MAKEPDDVVHLSLREIRARLIDLSTKLDAIEARVQLAERQFEDLRMAVIRSREQSTETPLGQTQQGAGIDELIAWLDKMNAGKLQ